MVGFDKHESLKIHMNYKVDIRDEKSAGLYRMRGENPGWAFFCPLIRSSCKHVGIALR